MLGEVGVDAGAGAAASEVVTVVLMGVVAFSNALIISISATASRFIGSGVPTTGAVGVGAGIGVGAVERVVEVVLLSCFEASGETSSALGPPLLVLSSELTPAGSVSCALIGSPSWPGWPGPPGDRARALRSLPHPLLLWQAPFCEARATRSGA